MFTLSSTQLSHAQRKISSCRGAYDSIWMSPKITSCDRPELLQTEIARSDEPFKGLKIFCWFTISGNGRELVGVKLCEMVLAIWHRFLTVWCWREGHLWWLQGQKQPVDWCQDRSEAVEWPSPYQWPSDAQRPIARLADVIEQIAKQTFYIIYTRFYTYARK